MSYDILYKAGTLKLEDNKYLLVELSGSNNVIDYDGKRSRDWWVRPKTFNSDSYFIFSKEDIFNHCEHIRNEAIKNYESYTDKHFGWYTAISLYGKSTGTTTYGNYVGFYKKALDKYSMPIEEYFDKGGSITIEISNSWSITKIQELKMPLLKPITVKTKEDFYKAYNLYHNLYNDKFFQVTISYYILENLINRVDRQSKLENSNKRRYPKDTGIDINDFYTLEFDLGYLVKKTKNGMSYATYLNSKVKKFKSEKEATKFLNSLIERSDFYNKLKVVHLVNGKKEI
jgi:hypothetical protein